jgi:hypothetical protein
MLYVALVLSSIVLLIAVVASRYSKHPIAIIIVCGIGFSLTLGFLMVGFFPPVAWQSLFLAIAVITWSLRGGRGWSFIPLALGATAMAYAITGWSAYRDLVHLQERFPYVSLVQRLPERTLAAPTHLSASSADRLDCFEDAIGGLRSRFGTHPRRRWERIDLWRVETLKELHENAVGVFVNRPGFGIMRMSGAEEMVLMAGLREDEPVRQPGPRVPPASLAATLDPKPKGNLEEALYDIHQDSVADFINPPGFGYVKDRQRVAGFQAHQFSKTPEAKPWRLQTLDLVGLVVHEEPVVYISAHLPRMEELREAPLRSLDDFETTGLATLQAGEDLYVREGAEVRRMLGAIRSTKQCLSCHGGQRGDLLGAFSYTFAASKP